MADLHDKRFKCIIAGSRGFDDYEYLKATINRYLWYKPAIEIVSGGASGADKLGERYAIEKGCDLKIFPADWNTYGRMAGPIRNEQMAKYADGCIVFWDGQSKGTRNMIETAKRFGLRLVVEEYLKKAE